MADYFPILPILRMMKMQRHTSPATVLGFFISERTMPVEKLLDWALVGFLGMLGGLASLFYPGATSMRFDWKTFVGKLVVAFFVGKVAGEFIDVSNQYRAGIIMLLGFFAYPVLGVLEVKVKSAVERFSPGGP